MDRLDELARLLCDSGNPDLAARFLRELLTPSEIHGLSSRWELSKRLASGESQRSIATGLGLSLCKITRGSRELKKPESALKTFIQRWQAAGGSVTEEEAPTP